MKLQNHLHHVILELAVIMSFLIICPCRVSLAIGDPSEIETVFSTLEVETGISADIYEVDNTRSQANMIVINHDTAQLHNFHAATDEDWVKFYGLKGTFYTIDIANLGADCSPVIELYYENDPTPIEVKNTVVNNRIYFDFECLNDGIYYVLFYTNTYGEETGYDLRVYTLPGAFAVIIQGMVTDRAGLPIGGALIKTDGNGSAISLPSGAYLMIHRPGSFMFTVTAPGYPMQTIPIDILEGDIITINFELELDLRDLLIFPHIASGTDWETDICIINTGDQCLDGDLKAYDNSGQLVSSASLNLTSHCRRQIIVGNFFPDPAAIGYIVFEADSSTMCGYTKFYIKGKYRVAVPAVSEVNIGDIYISHIAADKNWWTGISLLNTDSSSKALDIEFDNGTTITKTIAAKEHQAFTIKSLFGGTIQPDVKSAVIKNANGIVGLELFGSTGNSTNFYLSGVLLTDDTQTDIYYPHIACNSKWWTGIAVYNPSGSSCDLTITPFTADGSSLACQTLTLNGHEKYIGTSNALNFPSETAWFQIDSTNPITGFELFGTTNGNQMGGYTGVGISKTEGVFAKIEKDGWTGIAFVNIENSSATVTMTAYDDNGNVTATETIALNTHEKVVAIASDLFARDIGSATYISYTSTGSVVGFQLNGSSDNMMLDALPGM